MPLERSQAQGPGPEGLVQVSVPPSGELGSQLWNNIEVISHLWLLGGWQENIFTYERYFQGCLAPDMSSKDGQQNSYTGGNGDVSSSTWPKASQE